MHGIPAEVSEEVLVLLQHGDRHAGAGEQQAEDETSRASADDGAGAAVRTRTLGGVTHEWSPFGSKRGDSFSVTWPGRERELSTATTLLMSHAQASHPHRPVG